MSAIGLDVAEQSAMNSVNIEPLEYFKEVLSNRAHYVFEAPKLVAEIFKLIYLSLLISLNKAFSSLIFESIFNLCCFSSTAFFLLFNNSTRKLVCFLNSLQASQILK